MLREQQPFFLIAGCATYHLSSSMYAYHNSVHRSGIAGVRPAVVTREGRTRCTPTGAIGFTSRSVARFPGHPCPANIKGNHSKRRCQPADAPCKPAVEATICMMQTTNDIRTAFLDYFARNGHEIVPSSPLVPRNDPTLLFTNAGMVQFKNVFTGIGEAALSARRHRAEMRARRRQAQRSRKCRLHRAAPHLFRDARQFLVRRLFQGAGDRAGLEPDHSRVRACRATGCSVTVYAEDDEAAELWAKIAGLPEERIIRIATSDNFWAMGDVGPCGPCSEIF